MQRQNELNRIKIFFASLFCLTFLGGGWFFVTKNVYSTFLHAINRADVVKINIYGLWMPLGFIAVLIIVLAVFVVAFITKKKADEVWGDKGQSFISWFAGIGAIIGLVFAVVSYQWLTSELEKNGYTYCKKLSRYSAMGRHKVYVSDISLCKK